MEQRMKKPISVLIVDDHQVVRHGLCSFLETKGDFSVIAEAANGEEAIQYSEELHPDVVLMDLLLPGLDGIATTIKIKKVSPDSQVVVLTSYNDDRYIFPALRAGATSYVLKNMRMDQIAEILQKAARGEAVLDPHVAACVVQNIREEHGNFPHWATELTEREHIVLEQIANGYTNCQIAQNLTISEYTVKGHVSKILAKLHLSDRTQAAVFAWKNGIIQREKDS